MLIEKNSLLSIAVAEDSYCSVIQQKKSSAIKSANKATVSKKTELAENFLVNSYISPHDINNSYAVDRYFRKEYQLMQALQDSRDFSDLKRFDLPPSIPLKTDLGNCIVKRRSIREFTGDALNLQHIATLMRASAGITGKATIDVREDGYKDSVYFRAVASGGGLYPASLYITGVNVKGLPNGVHQYSPRDDALFQVPIQDKDPLDCFFGARKEIEAKRAGLVIFYVAEPWKSMQKYGARGLRFALHEIGAMSQNLNLACIALGLNSLDYAAFCEDTINQYLQFDGVQKTVLHTALVGIRG